MTYWYIMSLGLMIGGAIWAHSKDRDRNSQDIQNVLREIRDALRKK